MSKHFRQKLLQNLYRQQKVVFYTWWATKVLHTIIISTGVVFVFSGKVNDGLLPTVAGVLSQISVSSFAKYNQSRIDQQIKRLLDEIDQEN